VGFAIASNMVTRIANEIIAGHPVKHAYVGVLLNGASTGGAQVTQVQAGSPAATAGLRPGDLVTAIDGKKMTSTQQFIETVDTYSPGQTITLTVKRGGSTQDVKLTLGTRPNNPSGG
jgi:putative serine protease PepD